MPDTGRRTPITLTEADDTSAPTWAPSRSDHQAAEAGIREAARQTTRQNWLRDNAAAIEAYNDHIATFGIAIEPMFLRHNT